MTVDSAMRPESFPVQPMGFGTMLSETGLGRDENQNAGGHPRHRRT